MVASAGLAGAGFATWGDGVGLGRPLAPGLANRIDEGVGVPKPVEGRLAVEGDAGVTDRRLA